MFFSRGFFIDQNQINKCSLVDKWSIKLYLHYTYINLYIMFILRKIEKEATENIIIGDSYEVGRLGSVIFDEFIAINGDWCKGSELKCVIETPHDDGIPIFRHEEAYIMTENGQTFEKL